MHFVRIKFLQLFCSIGYLFAASLIFSQSYTGINIYSSDIDGVRISNIKSKSVFEYRYSNTEAEVLADSGYKAYYFSYDNSGRLSEYINYNVFYALTIKEVYSYSGDNIIQTARYNSAQEMIETVDYIYNTKGKLKKEIHTAFYNSVRPGVHFSILANINENELFSKLQDELELEPKLESYTITVNVSDPDELNRYVVIGDELDPTSPRYSWSQLSISSQRGLLSYEGPNRKEHTYKSKNIAKVNYKYDKNGNLIKVSVYNTSGDIIDKETTAYNGDNQKISHYKYNEKGRISSMETYIYDAEGRLTESLGLDPEGKLVSKLNFKYNESGNIDEKIWRNSAGEIRGRYKYAYDNNNRISEETKFRDENEIDGKTVYNHDENGNITEIIKYNADDKKERLTRFAYEYW